MLHEESFSYVIVDKYMTPAPSLKLQVCFFHYTATNLWGIGPLNLEIPDIFVMFKLLYYLLKYVFISLYNLIAKS